MEIRDRGYVMRRELSPPITEVEQVCLLGVVAQGRKGMIGDLPLMAPICAGCFSAGSPVPRRRRRRRRAATAAAYLRS